MVSYQFNEHDVLARPFTRNTATFVTSECVMNGGLLLLEHRLSKHHNGVADALAYGNIAGHAAGAWYSAKHLREK
jgi:hypothetical protein